MTLLYLFLLILSTTLLVTTILSNKLLPLINVDCFFFLNTYFDLYFCQFCFKWPLNFFLLQSDPKFYNFYSIWSFFLTTSKLLTTECPRESSINDDLFLFWCGCLLSLSTSSSSTSHRQKLYPSANHHGFLTLSPTLRHHINFHLRQSPHSNIKSPRATVVHHHTTKDQIA